MRVKQSVSTLTAMTAIIVVPLLSGCDGTVPEDTNTSQSSRALISRTIVKLNADGTYSTREMMITQEEHDRDVELRKLILAGQFTPTVTWDASCAPSSLWLYKHTVADFHPELCFYQNNTGTASWWGTSIDLAPFGWAGQVRSFWGGNQDFFFNKGAPNSCLEAYQSYTRNDVASACVQSATNLAICSDSTCF
jgi:hypothetical protein